MDRLGDIVVRVAIVYELIVIHIVEVVVDHVVIVDAVLDHHQGDEIDDVLDHVLVEDIRGQNQDKLADQLDVDIRLHRHRLLQ